MAATQSLQQYAATHSAPGMMTPLSLRTVKRWLADDELPGAYKDERGQWQIPADAVRTPRESGQIVQLGPRDVYVPPAPPVPVNLDTFPTMLTLQEAERLLNVPWRTIAAHGDYFDVVELDRKRVPLATIKRLRGITG